MRGSNSIQQVNKKKVPGASSRFFGVTWSKQKEKWYAKMTVNYKTISLGLFDNEEDAAVAYLSAVKERWGNNIRLADQKLLGLGNS